MFFYLILLICVFELSGGISTRGCGKSKNRLSNSTGVQISLAGETPWHVGIYKYNGDEFENVCCGSIISTHIIITAANCVYNVTTLSAFHPWMLKVVAGKVTYEWNKADRNAQQISVTSIHMPESYMGDNKSYLQNLALLGLSNKLEFNEFVSPVCIDLVDTGVNPQWRFVGASGWGFKTGNDFSPILRHVNLPFLNIRQCLRQYSSVTYRRYINPDKFCITNNEGRQNRDSGTGVIFQNENINYIHGVLSTNIAREFSVATNISKYTNWLRRTIAKIDSEEKCDGFRCYDGKCINGLKLCDGGNDCDDNSDESEIECGRGYSTGSSRKRGCILPIQIGGVSYTRVDCKEDDCELKPLSIVHSNEKVILNCGTGYAPKDENIPNFLCDEGAFDVDPQCIKLCPPIEKDNVLTTCEYNGIKSDCNDYSRPKTILKYKCNKFYKIKDLYAYKGYTVCSALGQWGEYLPTCETECGIVNVQNNTKPTNDGTIDVYGKYPWHVGIYKLSDNNYVNRCGGSLIHPHMVLTAAHCLFDKTTGKQFDISQLAVAGGKYKRDWYNHEVNQQSLYVRDVIIPEGYAGIYSRFQYDIGIINLSGIFNLNDFILPVCIDWENRGIYPRKAEGTIVGWGETEKKVYSENLREIHTPYLTKAECSERFKRNAIFITLDKFCVVYKDGAGAEDGDSGGGMTFPRDERYFIHGILSTKQVSTGTPNPFRTLTNVTSYVNWISSTVSKYNRLK